MAGPLLLSQIKLLGKAYDTLRNLGKPATADQPESIPHVLFDTQTYPQAGAAQLTFFNSTSANLADPTLSNFANGQLESFNFFEIHRAFIYIHSVPNFNASTALTGAAQDVEILHKTARGIHTLTMAGKAFFGFPIWWFGRPGGPMPFYAAYGTAAANTITHGQTENNGGFPVLGNIIIPPAQKVTGTLAFNATAISAATNITIGYMGVLHRPVR